jgi:hypothetical protein
MECAKSSSEPSRHPSDSWDPVPLQGIDGEEGTGFQLDQPFGCLEPLE